MVTSDGAFFVVDGREDPALDRQFVILSRSEEIFVLAPFDDGCSVAAVAMAEVLHFFFSRLDFLTVAGFCVRTIPPKIFPIKSFGATLIST